MREFGGDILFSASDLMRFMGCPHSTALDLMRLRGKGPEPGEDSEDAALLQRHGDAHEAAHLRRLKLSGKTVVEIACGDLASDAKATRDALAEGSEVVFQGAFLSRNWGGWSDFLERVERPSALGSFSYEVADTKLKRTPHPKHVLQLVLYSDLLTDVQGTAPEFAHIELGTGQRTSLRLADYTHYARIARARLETFVANPQPTRPVPCSDCGLCRWADHCASVWRSEDSLFNVANISRGQVKKLEVAGIKTMEALASLDRPVRGMADRTCMRLAIQARLQHARETGEPAYALQEPESGKGFALLPEPQRGDIFYDIEGDPHFDGGLEYLHGVWHDGRFRAFWAHNHQDEAKATADLLDFLRSRLEAHPDGRIYHYAPYEITALRRLTAKYGIGEAFLDRLLREQRFVDLFAVVRGGLICSEESYSIKSMEAFYGRTRDGEVKTGGGSVVSYEQWRETGEQRILDEIEDYNRIDCVSTEELRNWLVSIRPEGPWPRTAGDACGQQGMEDAEMQALHETLATSGLPKDRRDMLFNLGFFHKREARPAQWAVFDSVGKDEAELIEDLDALAGLEAVDPARPFSFPTTRTYRFPEQETRLRRGMKATVPVHDGPPATVDIAALDRTARVITLIAGTTKTHLLTNRLTLHPGWPLRTNVIASALRDVIADQCGPRRFTAIDDLLSRTAPRLTGDPKPDILDGADTVSGTVAAVGAMDGTVLPIQGPPGTGKTYVIARAILSLVRKGHRVGVGSNSHEAIRNVLMACLEALGDESRDIASEYVRLAHKISGDRDGYPKGLTAIKRTKANDDPALTQANVVGGTAFFFSRPKLEQTLDWLFVDEAGQVSLANMVAMGRAARNIVLVGDPRQLPQVIQGVHPEPANLSCLEWMLGDSATIPPGRGILLPVSRRMHPDVCRFISDRVYEGRLTSHPDTARQAVSGTRFPESGAFWLPVQHDGNAQVAREEVAAIKAAAADLLEGEWTDGNGTRRPMRQSDIIVVAPYNAQVNELRNELPMGIRVGTVDRFQGQEAPVCLVSMTASSANETTRGMEFLFSLNRINVAVSRAKGLALVFGATRLREAKCDTVEQMKLVNTLCGLDVFTN